MAEIKKNIYSSWLIILALVLVIGGAACTESIVESDRQIVEAVLSEWYTILKKDEVVLWADDAMETAAELSEKLFGSVISEEDAMEKAQAVWIELGWQSNIEDRNTYKAVFYDAYGVWMVDSFYQEYDAVSPSPYDVVPGSGYCVIMREADGEVLAAWIS